MEQKKLPPDPEGMNDDRADWAQEAIETFQAVTGTDDGDALSDLLCDLMHLCDRTDEYGDFASQLARAERCYADETCGDDIEEVDASEVVGADFPGGHNEAEVQA